MDGRAGMKRVSKESNITKHYKEQEVVEIHDCHHPNETWYTWWWFIQIKELAQYKIFKENNLFNLKYMDFHYHQKYNNTFKDLESFTPNFFSRCYLCLLSAIVLGKGMNQHLSEVHFIVWYFMLLAYLLDYRE